MEKAKENKKKGDLEDNYNKGKTRNSSRSNSSKHVFNIIDDVGIKLGPDENEIAENLEACLELNKSLNKAEVSRTVGSVDWGADIDYVRKVGENEKARGCVARKNVNRGIKVNGASTLGKKVENERLILEYQGHGKEGKNPMYSGENSKGGFGFHRYPGNQKCLF
jgi:hypothetical protein